MRFVAVVTKQYSAVANTLNEHVTTQCELRVRMNMMEKTETGGNMNGSKLVHCIH